MSPPGYSNSTPRLKNTWAIDAHNVNSDQGLLAGECHFGKEALLHSKRACAGKPTRELSNNWSGVNARMVVGLFDCEIWAYRFVQHDKINLTPEYSVSLRT